MAMGDPWILGKVVFPWPFFGPAPCPALDPGALYRAAPKPNAVAREIREKVNAVDWAKALGLDDVAEAISAKSGQFPCGWDERDYKGV